jgi:cbb3-type cytochrome oxidase subunit 1
MEKNTDSYLVKFIITSSTCFLVGTIHGVVQIMQPVRAWLDSIGSPYGGPGHMIDPLAHAHINVVGGVVIFVMGATYYLLPRMSGIPIFSRKLVDHTFWWTTIGIIGFYSTLMIFGITEGRAMLIDPAEAEQIHQYYGPTISIVATIMGIGFWVYFINIFATVRRLKKNP